MPSAVGRGGADCTEEGKNMRNLTRACALIALVASAGCMQMSLETVIEDDGSGTTAITFGMSTEVAEALKELSGMDESMNMDDMPDLGKLTREHAEKVAKQHGTEVKKFERSQADDQESLEMVFAFEDVRDVSHTINALMSEEEDDEVMQIFATADGNFMLATAVDPNAVAKEDASAAETEETAQDPSEMDPQAMQKSMELMGKLMAHMSEFDMRIAVTLPGDILESNAMEQDGRTAIWHVDASNMMSMQDQDMDPEIKFAGKGLKIKAADWQE
jgi:hypothetical protein